MARNILLLATIIFGTSSMLQAQDWTSGLFQERVHDFGTVARAAKSEYAFTFTNPLQSDIHISGVRTSCGCTTPKIVKETIAPGEEGSILAVFNTRTHLGQRGATLTVTFDRPHYAEVQLQIRGYIRQDVVIDPGVVKFGTVTSGMPAEQKVSIQYAGRSDWKIEHARADSDYFDIEFKNTHREAGRVAYEMIVKLKDDAPMGYVDQEITLVTNDRRESSQQIPLMIEGRIAPGISISPASLYLGNVNMGEQVTRQFVIRAQEPFRVLSVAADDSPAALSFHTDDEAKTLHVVTVTFTPAKPGKLEQRIQVETDIDGKTIADCQALAEVHEAPAE